MHFTHDFRTNCDLFSNQYLDEQLPETDYWQSVDFVTLKSTYDAINERWERERDGSHPEETFIHSMFRLLGIPYEIDESTEQGHCPTYGFFQSNEAAQNADDFYEDSVAIAHTRLRERSLNPRDERDSVNPSYWIHRSLQETPTAWAVLTNGRYWRLYHCSSDYVIDTYYEINLPAVLESDAMEVFKYFYLFFRHEAFLPDASGNCFLDYIHRESEIFTQELKEDLQENIHESIKTLAAGFLAESDSDLTVDDLERIYDSSIVYLYRLICVLYAESEHDHLASELHPHSLTSIKQEVAKELERDQPSYQQNQDDLWGRVHELFRFINGECCESLKHDPSVPPYNGGLFCTDPDVNDSLETRFLATHRMDDEYLARVIELLTRSRTRSDRKTFIDYTSLDVQYLGRVHEDLLEYELDIADETFTHDDTEDDIEIEPGDVCLTMDSGERKTTGSYYTPEYVVEYIVENTLEPLIDDIREDLVSGSDTGENGFIEEFTQRVFELNVLDPAMGCGTFLIRVVEYLSYQIIDAQETSKRLGIETVDQTKEQRQVYDSNRARRQVAKHCLYGVDVNPLAVELTKASLWLRTLASEQPPVVLDHHLKPGNSLVGSDIEGNEKLEQSEPQQQLEAIANVYTADEFGLDTVPADAYERMATAIVMDVDENVETDAWEWIEEAQWFQDAQQWADEDDYFHWKLEFPDVFDDTTSDRCDGSGFDAVIGNPPYVRIQNIKKTDPATATYLDEKYETTHQNYDFSLPFTEKGYELLREDGVFGYIETKKWIQGEYGKKLREYLVEQQAIHELVDFGDQQIFPGACTYTVLLFLRKNTTDVFRYANINDLHHSIDQLRCIQTADQFVHDDMYTYRESFDTLGSSPWVFTLPEEREILNNIEQHPTLGSISDTIFVGLQTSADAVYIVDIEEENDGELRVYSNALDQHCTIEKDITRPILRGKDIEKWTVTENDHRLIFPYQTDSKTDTYDLFSKRTLRQEYPNAWEYLNENKSQLLGRADVHEEAWWGYPYPKNLEKFSTEKLMTRVLTNQSSLAIDWDGSFAFVGGGNAGGYGITVEDGTIRYEALLALLNSALLEWTLKKESSQFRGGYYSYAKRYIEKLPICVDEMDTVVRIEPNRTRTVEDALTDRSTTIIDSVERRRNINTQLPDHLGNYNWGTSLGEITGCQLAPGVADSVLAQTANERDSLRIGTVDVTRAGERIVLKASGRYKPEWECTTDRWGYTETDMIPVLTFEDLNERERVLIEEFVPYSVNEASGFANFYETATIRNSLVDRFQALTLPTLDDVSKQLEAYLTSKDRARTLEQTIRENERVIDSIVYELYGIGDEQRRMIESELKRYAE